MSNGGYVFFDCRGLDLSSASEQKKDGIYADALKTIALNKPIYAIGCKYGSAPMSAVSVTVHMSDTTIIASANTLQVFITAGDVCTVSNLVS